MPKLRAAEWIYEDWEKPRDQIPPEVKAENKPGHKPINAYDLPNWVYHPDLPSKRIHVEPTDYYGMAADGNRNVENWTVAHVAAFHDDMKLLSLAKPHELSKPNRFGFTPAHMCAIGQPPGLCVLYELVQAGAADPEALNHRSMTPEDTCHNMQMEANRKLFAKVLHKGWKPDWFDSKKEGQMRPRGKYARALGLESASAAMARASEKLPICIMFPGQGSQYVGMMKELAKLDAVQDMLEKARPILGYDILDICVNGPVEKLSKTVHCQPAMFIAGLAAFYKLREDEPQKVKQCSAMAGLSLGEYTALVAAEVMTFEEGLALVKVRAEAMEEEANPSKIIELPMGVKIDAGGKKQLMVSIAGLDQKKVEELCAQSAGKGQVCQIANHLFPKGFACAGHGPAIEKLEAAAKEAGALQAKILETSGAFHTSLMSGARAKLMTKLDEVKKNMKPPRCAVYMNVEGKPIGPPNPFNVENVVKMMGDQLTNAVLWEQTMKEAIKDGCTEFIECGPSKQLKAMMKRIDPVVVNKTTNVLA